MTTVAKTNTISGRCQMCQKPTKRIAPLPRQIGGWGHLCRVCTTNDNAAHNAGK